VDLIGILAREDDAMISCWRNQQYRRQRDEAETRSIDRLGTGFQLLKGLANNADELDAEERLNPGEHDARFGQHLCDALI
jgi:hypothetical protein